MTVTAATIQHGWIEQALDEAMLHALVGDEPTALVAAAAGRLRRVRATSRGLHLRLLVVAIRMALPA